MVSTKYHRQMYMAWRGVLNLFRPYTTGHDPCHLFYQYIDT